MIDTVKADEVAVLKQDGMGRVKTPAARREQLLDEFERSGLSGTKFAAMAGVKYQTFALWARRRRLDCWEPISSAGFKPWMDSCLFSMVTVAL
jgi:hypothetical protein